MIIKKKNIYLFLICLISILFFPKISFAANDFRLWVIGDCDKSRPYANLSWDTATGTSRYIIYRSVDNGPFNYLASTTNLFYTDNNIVSDKKYDYRVNRDAWQSFIAGFSPLYCRPYFYEPTTICLSNGPRINLSWDPIYGNLNTYKVWRQKQGESGYDVFSTAANTYSDGPNLFGDVQYTYFIEAIWSSGYSTTSVYEGEGIWTKTAPACPPTLNYATSCLLSAEPGGPRVSLSWNSLLGVVEYRVYQIAPGTTTPSLLIATNTTSYVDNLVNSLPNKYYSIGSINYFVKAVWPTTEKQSSSKQVNVFPCPPFLKVVPICQSGGIMRSYITGSLGASTFSFFRGNGSNPPPISGYIGQISGSGPGFLDNNVGLGPVTYTYQVTSTAPGLTLTSNMVTKQIDCVNPVNPSPAPQLYPPLAECEGANNPKIINNWSRSDNAFTYQLFKNYSGEPIYYGPNDSYADYSVQGGYSYNYLIKAIGQGSASTVGNNVDVTAANCSSINQPDPTLNTGCELGIPFVDLSNWDLQSNVYTYEIWRLDPGTTSYAWRATLGSTTNYWRDEEVATSTNYSYKVIAKGPPGIPSAESNPELITTYSCFPFLPNVVSKVNSCDGTTPKITLTWTTDESNTHHYDIWRIRSGGPEERVAQIANPIIKTWTDSVDQEIAYQYKVVAIGYLGQSTTTGYSSITSYYCLPPDPFTLYDPVISCQSGYYSYPKATTTWTNSNHAIRYILNRHFYNNGTISETTTLVAPVTSPTAPYGDRGQGYALSFSGDDSVNIGQPEELMTLYGLTIEFWVKPSVSDAFLGVLSSNDYWSDPGTSFYFRSYSWNPEEPYQLRFSVTPATSARQTVQWGSPSSFKVEANRWYHIVGTYDSTIMELWLDGTRRGSDNTGVGGTIHSTADWKIGAVGGVGNFRGEIDNVRIYNRRLSSTEIREHYRGIYSNESGLLGAWFFDEGVGVATETISDSSNNRNDAVLWGTPGWVKNGIQQGSKYSWLINAYSYGPFPTPSAIKPVPAVTIPACPPIKTGLELTKDCRAGKAVVDLDWSFSLQATSFQIWRSTGTDVLVKTINLSDPEFNSRLWTDDRNGLGLATGTVYTYWVRAVGPGGTKDSDHLTVETPFYCGSLPQPSNISAQSQCSGYQQPQVLLTWDAVYGAVWYDIFRQGELYKSNATTNSFLDVYPYVLTNKNYYYSIIAYNYATNSVISASTSVYVDYCPVIAPTTSVSTDCRYSDNKVINEINWEDNTFFSAAQYNIWRRDPGGNNNLIGTVSETDSFALKPTSWNFGSYFSCANSPILQNDLQQQLTIEFWMKPTEYYNDWGVRPIRKYNSTGDATFAFYYYGQTSGNNGKISFYAARDYDDDGDYDWGQISRYSNSALTLNEWHHIVLSYTSSTGGYLYVDNISQGGPVGGGLLATNTESILLGSFKNGLIDEMRIYRRALSANEVQEHYNRTYNNEKGLIVHWRFNEGVGSVIRDSSGYNHTCVDTYGQNSAENAWQKLSGGDPTYNLTDTKFASNIRKFVDDGILYPLSDSSNYNYWVEIIGQKGDSASNPLVSMVTYGCSIKPEAPTITNLSTGCLNTEEPYNTLSWTTTTNTLSSNIYRTVGSDNATFSTRLSPFKDWASHSLFFDGSGSGNVWVSDSNSSIDGRSAITVEVWFYIDPAAPSTNFSLITDDWLCLHTFRDESFHLRAGSGYQSYGCGSTESGYIGHAVYLSRGQWYHLVGTFDAYQKGNNMKLYLNGQLNAARRFACGPLAYGSGNFNINPGWFDTDNANGLIDEVRVYGRALSAAEIAEHYKGVYKNETELRLALHFDEGTSTVAYDSSGRNSYASLSLGNGVVWQKITSESNPFYSSILHNLPVEKNKSYLYGVRGAAQSRESDPATDSIDTTECGPWVSNFTVEPQCRSGDSDIELDWEHGNNLKSFVYKKRTASTTYQAIQVYDSYFLDSDIEPLVDYDYYILIEGEGGSEASSSIISTTSLLCLDPPETPTTTKIEAGCSLYVSKVYLEWIGEENTGSYDVLRRTGGCVGEFEKVNSEPILPSFKYYTDYNLNNSTQYCYQIKSIGAGSNNFAFSQPIATTTYNCETMPPDPPVWIETLNPTVTWLNYDDILRKVSLTWWQQTTNATSFIIMRNSGLGFAEIGRVSGGVYSYEDFTVEDGKTYYYRIDAQNKNPGITYGLNEPEIYVPIAPPGPFTLSGQWTIINSQILFDWTDAHYTESGGPVDYKFFRASTRDFSSPRVISCGSPTATTCTDSSVDPLEPWYRVEANNNGGTTYSNILNMYAGYNLLWKEVKPD